MRRFVLAGSVLLVLTLSAAPAWSELQFDRIAYPEGLANSSVSSIIQDTNGFLWFGTQAGLQRYDGYSMNLLTSEPFNPDSLSHQLVQTLFLDDTGILWVGTYGGINRLDPATGRLTHFRHDPSDPTSLSNDVVVTMTRDASGTLWAGTLDGLNRLDDEEAGRFTRFTPNADDPFSLPHSTIRSLLHDSRGRLWVGSYGGLSRVETAVNGAVRFRTLTGEESGGPLPSSFVMALAEGADGEILVGSWGGGLTVLSVEGLVSHRVSLPDNRVYSVLPARSGLLYLGTWGGGLVIYNPDTGQLTQHQHDTGNPGSIAHNIVYSLFEDTSGIVWIGTNGNGISKLDPVRRDFRYIHRDLPESHRLGSGRVQLLYEDVSRNRLYAVIQNEGIDVRDGVSGRITRLRHDPAVPHSLGHSNVTSMLTEPDGSVLVGHNAGLDRYYPDENRFERAWDIFDSVMPTPPIVYAILRDIDGSLWVGTYDAGVLRRLPDGTIRHYQYDPADPTSLSSNLVYHLFQDSFGAIWVSTNGGLNRYVPETDRFHRFLHDAADPASLSANSVGRIAETNNGDLWIATRSGGLARFHRSEERFSYIGTPHGMTSNLITGFLETAPGELHVATTNGMNRVRFDPIRIDQVDDRDGLTVREFAGGFMTTAGGEHLFGAFGTIVRIPPAPDPTEGTPPPVQITAITVMNQPFDADRAPHLVRAIELPHTRNFIGFQFAALDFSVPRRNQFRYRMVGIDPGWVDAGDRRLVEYTSLPPGRYLFEVVGSNSRGTWSTEAARIEVHIRPPFWRTAWFAALMAVIAIAIAWTVLKLRTRALILQTQQLEYQVAARTEDLSIANAQLKEANATRDRFFSIIAHDLRGPIHGMASVMDTVVRDFSSLDREQLQEISSVVSVSAQGLQSMLENLLEWSQLHTERTSLSTECISIAGLLHSVCEAYHGAALAKSVTIETECDETVWARVDPHALKTTIGNLVNNAVKFTRFGDGITVTARTVHTTRTVQTAREGHSEGDAESGPTRSTVIAVHDTGVGIAADKLPQLFASGRVYRSVGTAGEKGTGLGLTLCRDIVERLGGTLTIESTAAGGSAGSPGAAGASGTTVTVSLPWCDPSLPSTPR